MERDGFPRRKRASELPRPAYLEKWRVLDILKQPESALAQTRLDNLCGKCVHLVGVGGSGMSSLAAFLAGSGCCVTGSDLRRSDAGEQVKSIGVNVMIGHRVENLPVRLDAVVQTAAATDANPEIRSARERGVPVYKYAQMVGHVMSCRRGVAVAGTHGKTTTTSMIATILDHAGVSPSFLIGGCVPQLGAPAGLGGRAGKSDILVVEACEYDRSFWNFTPELAVINNIDFDHMDYFRNEADLLDAFCGFADRIKPGGALVANADDPRTGKVLSGVKARKILFGVSRDADWRYDAENWQRKDGRTTFTVSRKGKAMGDFVLRVRGGHNIMNALAATAVCMELGVPVRAIRSALADYHGAMRRMEFIGSAAGVDVIDDYGHHPTEIRATLAAMRLDYPDRRLWCVFQPHQYSRTRLLLEDFATAFGNADRVIVPDIYSVRDTEEDLRAVSSSILVAKLQANGVDADHVPALEDVAGYMAERMEAGDIVLTMGAGPVNQVGRSLLARLNQLPGVLTLAHA
jgi:UDP-N-acetylmuramate--alanine ligase